WKDIDNPAVRSASSAGFLRHAAGPTSPMRFPRMSRNERRRLVASGFSLFLILSLHGTAIAQQKAVAAAPAPPPAAGGRVGKVAGRVTNPKGEPQAYVNVIVLGTKQGTMTDEKGDFSIPGVTVGSVDIRAFTIGSEPVVQHATVNAGVTTTVNFTLGAG